MGKEPEPENKAQQQTPHSPGWHEPGASRPVAVDGWYKPDNGVEEDTLENGEDTLFITDLPGTVPEQSGGWYTPVDAQLNALLANAGDTINEVFEQPRKAAVPPAAADKRVDEMPVEAVAMEAESTAADELVDEMPVEDTQVQEVSDTRVISELPQTLQTPQAQDVSGAKSPIMSTEEPKVPAEGTPVPESTPAQPGRGLSPAEAAFLAEQRAKEAQAGQEEASPVSATQPLTIEESPVPASPVQPGQTQPVVTGSTAAQPPVVPVQATSDVRANVPAPAPAPRPNPYKEVERKVNILRQRYKAGYLTRDELQNELRGLMILDDAGRWWMIGLDSNRWYSYDGREWKVGVPLGYDAPDIVAPVQNAVPTETGVQQVVAEAVIPDEEGVIKPIRIELDEDGLPLPARVPQTDPGATLVSPGSPFLEPVRRSEAPTQTHSQQVTPGSEMIARPDQEQMTQPARPESPIDAGQTMRSPGMPDTVAPPGIPVPQRTRPGEEATIPSMSPSDSGAAVAAPVEKPKYKLGEYPQPDYSAALGFSHNRRTYIKWGMRVGVFGVIFGMALTLCVLLGMVGYYFYVVSEYRDIVSNLDERASKFETSEIYDANGKLLAKFDDPNQGTRESVPLDQISPWLIDATIATENETFYTDPGFSVFAIVRAAYQNLQSGSTVSGASTITQQLARALVLEKDFAQQISAERKINEIIVASEIKRQYSKNQILEIYLNEIFYANRAYGIEAASQVYFGKSAAELNPAEAAFLAGLPQSPAMYDPVLNREAAMLRMNDVLFLMAEANGTGCVTIQHEDKTAWGVPNGGALCIIAQTAADGSTIYYYQTPGMEAPEEMTLMIAQVQTAQFSAPTLNVTHPHFVNYVWQQLEAEYGAQAIYTAGYRVYTTLDETIQAAAETQVTDTLNDINTRLGANANNASVVVMRPADGAVLAMVGSADYNNEDIDGQVNVAFTAQQPGSSIKPIVYLAAFEPTGDKYLTPASVLWDVYSNFNGYIPTNFDFRYRGPVSVRYALGNSLNVPAVKALNYIGVEDFTDMASRAHLQFPLGDPLERQAGLPTALGAVEVRLFDMVGAYSMLANNGRYVDPYAILYIQDKNGNVIYQADNNPEGEKVVEPEYAYLVTSILSDPDARADEFGYGWPIQLSGNRPAAVKTGTSNDARDVWTIGYTPQVVVGVWVGNTDDSPMSSALSGYYGAAPLWYGVMEAALAGKEMQQFTVPPNLVQYEVCDYTGAQASEACAGHTHTDIFAAGALPPTADQSIFRTAQVDSYTGKLVNEYCQDSVENRTFILTDDVTVVDWVNNTAEGQAWAQGVGITPPIGPMPTEACSPNDPRPSVIVNYPPDGSPVSGVITLLGMVNMPDLDRYELRYGEGTNPTAFSAPLWYDTTPHFTANEPLGQFDTRAFPNGEYTLRLTAIDKQGRSVSRDVHVTIQNVAQQPTPAPTLTPGAGAPVESTPIAG